MAEQNEELSVRTLCDGAAIQLIDEELQKVWENVQDSNTSPTKTRKVVFTIEVKPDEKRDLAEIELGVEAKLASTKKVSGRASIGISGGRATAVEYRSRQTDLESYTSEKVRSIADAREGSGS
jgi:hypothetical protein